MLDDQYQDFTDQMTTITRSLFEQAINPDMSVSEAVAYLKENARIRTLGSVLMKYAGTQDEAAVRAKLVRGFMANHPESLPETVQRRIRDWLRSPSRTIDKDTAMELAFILGLELKQADAFLAALTDEGFHWRDPKELAYIFALTHGMDYPAARLLAEKADIIAKPKKRSCGKKNREAADEPMTQVVRAEAENIRSEEELLEYIQEAAPRLGSLHQTAYHMFSHMMDVLGDPGEPDGRKGLAKEERMSAREILQFYMHRGEVPLESRAGVNLSAVEKAIIKNWPSEKELSQMRSRTIEVSRKVLLLLFLATDGEPIRPEMDDDEYDDDLWFDEEDEDDDDARFRSALVRMQTMLSDCGLRGIDARVPFDWMILYCLCGADSLEIDGQVSQFLQEMFSLNGNAE